MKSMYDTSTCSACNQKIAKGVEIERNDTGKWVHSVCPTVPTSNVNDNNIVNVDKIEVRASQPQEVLHPDDEADIYKNCIEGCVRAAEFFKSIDYPKEMWNLSTIWNCERIKGSRK